MSSKVLIEAVHCTKCEAAHHPTCVPASALTPNKEFRCPGCIPQSSVGKEPKTRSPTNLRQPEERTIENSTELVREIRSLREDIGAMREEIRKYRAELTDIKTTLSHDKRRPGDY
ncbi:unnamed protein product [Arctia plantaginis]|uniref:Uncharacterized protein n=1 Tax=Arctia plantaginis TaxID=874455 RepID=A0A8S1AZW9_ARCPL|nr:unnamed protein product [Arctia plantaginis]